MKKFLLFLLLLFVFVLSLSAVVKLSPALTRGFLIEGGVGTYSIININPIHVTNQKSYLGFPFDITGSDVAYSSISGGGRQIASWDIATNKSNVTLSITSTPLCFSNNMDIKLDYYLVFHLSYASFNEKGQFIGNIQKDIISKSGETTICTIDNTVYYEPFPIVSYNQDIRFYFAEDVNPNSSEYPYGFYSSTVTISVSGD